MPSDYFLSEIMNLLSAKTNPTKDKNLLRHVLNREICHLLQKIAKFAEFREIPQSFHHYFECHLCPSKFEQFPRNQTSCYKSR